MPSWDDLTRPGQKEVAPESPEAKRFAELCAAVFTHGAGADLLQMMRARTIEHRSPARAHEAQLREDEAVRCFVAMLEKMRDRGNAAKAKPS